MSAPGVLPRRRGPAEPTFSAARSEQTFLGVAMLLFVVSAAATVLWCRSMSAMGEMQMPGRWTMSMMWMRMPGRTWLDAATSFVGMWILMMVAMMLPSLVPKLLRYRQAVRMSNADPARLTALVCLSYFLVWAAFGMLVFPLGVTSAAVVMRIPTLAHAFPIVSGVVVMVAGAFQLTRWKARLLTCCRQPPTCAEVSPPNAGTAWQYGLRLGFRCCCCCAGLTAMLMVLGVMDLRAMGVVTLAITLERLASAGGRVAQLIGLVLVGAGLILTVQAARFRTKEATEAAPQKEVSMELDGFDGRSLSSMRMRTRPLTNSSWSESCPDTQNMT